MLNYNELNSFGTTFNSPEPWDPALNEEKSNRLSLLNTPVVNFRVDYIELEFASIEEVKLLLLLLKPYGLGNFKTQYSTKKVKDQKPLDFGFGCFLLYANYRTSKYIVSFPGAFSGKVLFLLFKNSPYFFKRVDLRFEHKKQLPLPPFYGNLYNELCASGKEKDINVRTTSTGTTIYIDSNSIVHSYKFYSHALDPIPLTKSLVIEHSLKTTKAIKLATILSEESFINQLADSFIALYKKSGTDKLKSYAETTSLLLLVLGSLRLPQSFDAQFVETSNVYVDNEKICLLEHRSLPLLVVLNFLYGRNLKECIFISKKEILDLMGMTYTTDNLSLITAMLNDLLKLQVKSTLSNDDWSGKASVLITDWSLVLLKGVKFVELTINVAAFKKLFTNTKTFRIEILKKIRLDYLSRLKKRQLPNLFYPLLAQFLYSKSDENLTRRILKRDAAKISALFLWLGEFMSTENLVIPLSSSSIKTKSGLLFKFQTSSGELRSFTIEFK